MKKDKLWGDKQVYNFAIGRSLKDQSIATSIRDNPKQRLSLMEKSQNWEDLSYIFSKGAPISQQTRNKFRVHRSTVKNGDLTKQATVDMVSIIMDPKNISKKTRKQNLTKKLVNARQHLTHCDRKHIRMQKIVKHVAQHPQVANAPKGLNIPASKQLGRGLKITMKHPVMRTRGRKPSKKLAMATRKQSVHR